MKFNGIIVYNVVNVVLEEGYKIDKREFFTKKSLPTTTVSLNFL